MSIPFQVVVSAANNLYMAWQCQVFCLSAKLALGLHPIVFVHCREGLPLRPEFELLTALKFDVIKAPFFGYTSRGDLYPPRNEIGSLIHAALRRDLVNADHILFCEPDMLFVDHLSYEKGVSAEYYGYMSYDHHRIQHVLKKYDLHFLTAKLNAHAQIGVPYLIPTAQLSKIADRWLEVMDSFVDLEWISVMHAFGIALTLEGIDFKVTKLVDTNYRSTEPLTRSIIHYGYGDLLFDKRNFRSRSPLSVVTDPLSSAHRDTIFAEIMRQIQVAKLAFGSLHESDLV